MALPCSQTLLEAPHVEPHSMLQLPIFIIRIKKLSPKDTNVLYPHTRTRRVWIHPKQLDFIVCVLKYVTPCLFYRTKTKV